MSNCITDVVIDVVMRAFGNVYMEKSVHYMKPYKYVYLI